MQLFLRSVVTVGVVLFLFWASTDWTFVCRVLAPLLRATWRGTEGVNSFPELLLLPWGRSEQLGHPTQTWAAILRGGQGDRDKTGSLTSALCWKDEAGLAWQRHKARKILIGTSNVKREGKGLSSPQEKGCKLFFLLRLLKTISVQIFCDLFPWEFCIEIGNRNNERGKSGYVELVGKYYCSCFSWSFRSQSLKEKEEPLVAPGLAGLNAFLLCPELYFCPPVFLGHLYPFQLSKDLHLSQARLRWSAGNRLNSEQHVLHLKCDFYLTRATGSPPRSWGEAYTEALRVLWMGSRMAPGMCFPLKVHQDIFYPALQTSGAQILVFWFFGNPSSGWSESLCRGNWSQICVYAYLLGCHRDRGCRRKHEAGAAQGEENRFVIDRKEQMALVVMPIFIFNVNIPPGAPALQCYVTQHKSIWGERG